jgi:hypothetical protein
MVQSLHWSRHSIQPGRVWHLPYSLRASVQACTDIFNGDTTMAELAIPLMVAAVSTGASYAINSGQQKKMQNAQDDQRAQLAAERDRLGRVEEGQKRARLGGRGLLSFLDEDNADTQKRLGGTGQAQTTSMGGT